MTNNQIIISRIQNRRGLKENLPQPLLPGEIALTVDTGELWIGRDPSIPPYGVRTYSSAGGDITQSETIVDTEIAVAKFNTELTDADYETLLDALQADSSTEDLTEDDVLWDGLQAVFITADNHDVGYTIDNILDVVEASTLGPGGSDYFDSANSGALGALNDPYVECSAATLSFADTDPDTITRSSGDFTADGFFSGQKIVVSGSASNDGTYTIDTVVALTITLVVGDSLAAEGPVAATLRGRSDPTLTNSFNVTTGAFEFGTSTIISNSVQGGNAAMLINEINGAGIVTTFGNLQVATSGVGVGTPTFRDMVITDTDSGFTWSDTGTASADSTTDSLTFVSGNNIEIDVDTTLDAIRISNTEDTDPDKIVTTFTGGTNEFTLTGSTGSFTNVTGWTYDLDNVSDVIFVDYSLNIDGATDTANNYTVAGQMRIVGNSNVGTGTATLLDDQTEVRNAALSGAVSFQAAYSSGSVQIQYTNSFTSDVTLRVTARRWMSY